MDNKFKVKQIKQWLIVLFLSTVVYFAPTATEFILPAPVKYACYIFGIAALVVSVFQIFRYLDHIE